MIDKDQIIKAQQEKIERIEQLQEDLHKFSMIGLLVVNVLGLDDKLETPLKTIHDVSHAIKDVLDGMSPQEAIKKNMTEKDDEE